MRHQLLHKEGISHSIHSRYYDLIECHFLQNTINLYEHCDGFNSSSLNIKHSCYKWAGCENQIKNLLSLKIILSIAVKVKPSEAYHLKYINELLFF